LAAAGGIFGRFGKKLKKVGKSLKKGKSVLSAIRDVAEVGAMVGVPGAGMVSRAAGTGANMMGRASEREQQMSALMGN